MKNKSLIKITIFVAGISVIGKLIGFIREAIIAAYFGANNLTDAYFLARNMPALLFPAVCNSISTAFLSVFISKVFRDGEHEGNKFATKALIVTLTISTILSVFAFLITPYIVPIFAPGFNAETERIAILLTKITMAAFTLTMAQYMFTAILNSKKLFYSAQISGVLNNIFIIIIILAFGRDGDVQILTWATIGGLFVQVIILLFFTKKAFSFVIDDWSLFTLDIKKMLKLSGPILLGNSIVQLSQIVDKILASGLMVGAVSALSYTNSLSSIVTSVFIVSLSTVLYPALTENASRNDYDNFSKNLMQNLVLLVVVLVPISIVTYIYSNDIISIVYSRGKFDKVAVHLTSTALSYYSISFVFIAIREVINRGFYAIGDTKTPMKNGVISVGLNIIFSIILTRYMGIGGIALGSSIAAALSSYILSKSLQRKIEQVRLSQYLETLTKIFISALITIFIAFIASAALKSAGSITRFVFATFISFSVYVSALYLLKCNEILYVIRRLRKKVSK
ncbi:putative peptidoglycan lipid II flippase [Ruminiclostridium sufflavum DSM 19573]|uniref:Probable lipid II flippase MurJ n=1 Tax=Ruminiclostridium sufflavum DSM 19573 TaxID=1121337 RepID=A0A318XLC0_9FIRM|nr:murein biosynthesis integral membrane protein MurJ [Ruminiclostridium sufflavum]PYG87173.1 putative peptidoglycan lipid II flippase [Ruminiclostridium sufflavum DSM 19573]